MPRMWPNVRGEAWTKPTMEEGTPSVLPFEADGSNRSSGCWPDKATMGQGGGDYGEGGRQIAGAGHADN